MAARNPDIVYSLKDGQYKVLYIGTDTAAAEAAFAEAKPAGEVCYLRKTEPDKRKRPPVNLTPEPVRVKGKGKKAEAEAEAVQPVGVTPAEPATEAPINAETGD